MKKPLITFLLCLGLLSYGQDKSYNLDFEETDSSGFVQWNSFGAPEYPILVDENEAQNGSKSAAIAWAENATQGYKALAYSLPSDYEGRKIKLTGYIKTEEVTDGYAGLWLRLDPRMGFDNMNDRGATGTTDWQQFEIVLDLDPQQTQRIVFGALLVGKGKMWVDNLMLYIDDQPFYEAPSKMVPFAQEDREFDEGSNISISTPLADPLLNDLALLGKVWGFLKYHHPAIGTGDYNWDYELFRMLPDFLESGTPRHEQILSWIDQFGEIPTCSDCKATNHQAFLRPDLSWVDAISHQGLCSKLKEIYQNRHQGNHYYIAMANGVGNPEFKNENAYENMPYPDAGFRLLALYKYWNMIQYYFPYRHLIDKDWSAVLKEYIPEFLGAKDELAYELAALQIIADIKDTHANLWGGGNALQATRGDKYPPVKVRFIENQLVVTDFFNAEHESSLGLALGDVITHIGGQAVADLVEELTPYYPASNQPTRLRDISMDLLRSNADKVTITYHRGGTATDLELPLFDVEALDYYRWYRPEPDSSSYKKLGDDIGYITLKNIKQEDIPKIKEEFANTRGIIIDIRNYPSTFVPFSLGSFFLQETTPFVKFTGGNVNNPGEFVFGESISIPASPNAYKGKVVILVNELSQSQAEYTTMAFRASPNSTVVGSTTAGADGNVSSFMMPGGLRTMISGIGVYYPNGDETQRTGIVPDVEVLPTVKGIREGRDELLEKAIAVINSTSLDKTKK